MDERKKCFEEDDLEEEIMQEEDQEKKVQMKKIAIFDDDMEEFVGRYRKSCD